MPIPNVEPNDQDLVQGDNNTISGGPPDIK